MGTSAMRCLFRMMSALLMPIHTKPAARPASRLAAAEEKPDHSRSCFAKVLKQRNEPSAGVCKHRTRCWNYCVFINRTGVAVSHAAAGASRRYDGFRVPTPFQNTIVRSNMSLLLVSVYTRVCVAKKTC